MSRNEPSSTALAPSQPPAREIHARVFLVGCPRSGTTLLQTLVMSHSLVESFPESFFFTRGLGGRRGRVLGIPLKGWYQWWHLRRWRSAVRAQGVDLPWVWPHWSLSRMARAFTGALDRVTLARGKTVWVEKTPSHLLAAERIAELVPDAKFLQVVRDGRANVASIYEVCRRHPAQWGGERSIEQCVALWNHSVGRSLRFARDPRHRIVPYADLAADPAAVLRGICQFLQLSFEPAMLTRYPEALPRVTAGGEAFKAGVTEAIRDRGLEKYHAIFDAGQRALIERALDWDTFRALGCTPVPDV